MKRQAIGEEPIETLSALPLMVRLRLTNLASLLMNSLFGQVAKGSRSKGSTRPAA